MWHSCGFVDDEASRAALIHLGCENARMAIDRIETDGRNSRGALSGRASRKAGGRMPPIRCLEQSRGALIYALMKFDFLVLFPINPAKFANYRQAVGSTSGAKDDGPHWRHCNGPSRKRFGVSSTHTIVAGSIESTR